jgi:5'(3')-deoxyribonucleotidase
LITTATLRNSASQNFNFSKRRPPSWRQLDVGFDLDGVCYDFANSLRRYVATLGMTVPEYETTCWEFYKSDWGWTTEEFLKHCHDGADAGFVFCGPARPNAVEAMNKVKEMGHKVHIITDRAFGKTPSVSEENTRRWLDEHGFRYDTLTFSADKAIRKTDIFVEDKIENFEHLWLNGTPTWLINRPWNAALETQYRIDDISDYPTKVEEMSYGLIQVS